MKLTEYLLIRAYMADVGLENDLDDDVMDAFVEIDACRVHYTDRELNDKLADYRTFENEFPEYVGQGDALFPAG